MRSASSWQWTIQLLRYGTLGVLTNVSGYLLYLAITHLGVGSKVAMTVLYCVGVCISFIGNRNWVFGNDASVLATTIRYCAAYVVGYVINFSILAVFVDRLSFPHAYVQAVSIVIVAVFLFISFKLFVFPRSNVINGGNG